MKKTLAALLVLAAAAGAAAQNPVISGQFSADPTARVFNGRMYLYPSHDIHSPVDELKEWFCMEDYHVFSSDDLTGWKDHGVIVSQNAVPWVKPDSYAMWAPDCVEKDGRYYFFFPAAPRGMERGFAVGVAVADAPEGPFMPMFRPIKGVMGIDPCVLVDDDGRCYIYWCGGGMWGAELAANMMELASERRDIEGLPDGFKEGPFVFKREGKYYYTFPWVRNNTETLAYAMGDSPLGPFEFKGIIMDESPSGCWTNHHSIVEYGGQWYLFYHHNDYSPEMDKRRSVRIDTLAFNPDGTIRKVTPTLRGVGLSPARSRIHIDRYSSISPRGASIAFLDPADKFRGWFTAFTRKGATVRYDRVDFGTEPVQEMAVMARSSRGGVLQVGVAGRRDSVIARVDVPASQQWSIARVPVQLAPSGIKNLEIKLVSGSGVDVDWIGFDAAPAPGGETRNLFVELGHSPAEVDARLNEIFNSLFFGPRRIYFEDTDSTAYISDIKNHDVRTEGMSYGMMAAVQLDRKDIFDRLWRWSRLHMQHHGGDRDGYFAWSCATDGTPNAAGSASDGELYFITSLIFASNRWGDDTGIDYGAEARNILDRSMQKTGMDRVAPLVDTRHKLITFTPDPWGGRFTDPSYHVPAFYEVWARWAGDGRSAFWKDCARASREYLHKAAHPVTGLTPDYSAYDGSLLGRDHILGDAFRFDSWRVPMNIALDYTWSGDDAPWQRDYADRIQQFFYGQGIDSYVDQYNVDGTPVERVLGAGGYEALRHSPGLVSTLAAASLAATRPRSREFAERLWDLRHEPDTDGYFDAYYDGLLRLFAFMHLSGNYKMIEPQNK